jgi:hypothetical protein
MGLVNRTSIVSFDPIKSLAANIENPNIPTGFYYETDYWLPSAFEDLYKTVSQVPEMRDCIKRMPNGTAFINAIFQSGDVAKAVNAKFLDMHYKIYDNPLYSNDTLQTLRNNYNPNISAGAWTLYSMKMGKEEDAGQDAVIDRLVKQRAEHLITDDVYRMLDKIGRPQTPPTLHPTATTASQQNPVFLHVVLLAVFIFLLIF